MRLRETRNARARAVELRQILKVCVQAGTSQHNYSTLVAARVRLREPRDARALATELRQILKARLQQASCNRIESDLRQLKYNRAHILHVRVQQNCRRMAKADLQQEY